MLEKVIEARLKLQSTQKELEKLLNVDISTINELLSTKFFSKFNALSEENKKTVLGVIGGKVNIKETNKYVNEKVIHVHNK